MVPFSSEPNRGWQKTTRFLGVRSANSIPIQTDFVPDQLTTSNRESKARLVKPTGCLARCVQRCDVVVQWRWNRATVQQFTFTFSPATSLAFVCLAWLALAHTTPTMTARSPPPPPPPPSNPQQPPVTPSRVITQPITTHPQPADQPVARQPISARPITL